jgi:hypothetical protein
MNGSRNVAVDHGVPMWLALVMTLGAASGTTRNRKAQYFGLFLIASILAWRLLA